MHIILSNSELYIYRNTEVFSKATHSHHSTMPLMQFADFAFVKTEDDKYTSMKDRAGIFGRKGYKYSLYHILDMAEMYYSKDKEELFSS